MSNFITLGYDGLSTPVDVKMEKTLNEIFLRQYEYIFSGDESEVFQRFNESKEGFSSAIKSLFLSAIFAGSYYAFDLIRTEVPGFSKDPTEDLIRAYNIHIQESINKMFDTTYRRLQILMEQGFSAAQAGYVVSVIGNRPSVINEYENVYLFNQGIVVVLKTSGFVDFVRWVTAQDESVCPTCRPLNGVIMPLLSATTPPIHWGCRCKLAFIVDKRKSRLEGLQGTSNSF